MKITINELRHIIREEIEAAYDSEEMNEGLGKWLAGAALAGGLALGAGAMKDSGEKSHDNKAQSSMQASTKSTIENKVDGMSKDQVKKLINKLKNATSDSRFKLGLQDLEKKIDGKEDPRGFGIAKLGLKTFATDMDFAHHQTVADAILDFNL